MANWGFDTGASGYDAKDRLIAWNGTDAGRDQSWTLTDEGDWSQITDAAVTENRTHGPAHELTAIDLTSLTYESKGNLTQNVTGDTYTWDFDNRMKTATVSGAVSTYAYDALGRRTSKETAAAKTVFVPTVRPIEYSPQAGQVLAEYPSGTAPSSPTEKYVYACYIDEPIIKVGTGGTVYYHANDLYSVAALTDTGGSPIELYAYTAYGVLTILAPDGSTVRSTSSFANPYTFTGRRWDSELELYYYRARYYDPALGRFVGRDPFAYECGINLWQYVGNAPLSWTDAHGTSRLSRWCHEWWQRWFPPAAEEILPPFGSATEGLECAAEMLRTENIVNYLRYRRDHEMQGTPEWNSWDRRLRNALRMLENARRRCTPEQRGRTRRPPGRTR